LTICGNCGSGGATRVEVHGPGSGTGLDVLSGPGSAIRNLVIDGFSRGIDVGSDGVTITGSVAGPNANYGIVAHAVGVHIGGTAGITTGGPCSGDCNLVSGNGGSGLYLSSSGTVEGNFIGTTRNGATANANGMGILVSSGTWTIGGTSASAANVVSGNGYRGIDMHGCTCHIQGNFIGTNAKGTKAVANSSSGIVMTGSSNTVIGGNVAGAGNVISANGGSGIELYDSANVYILRNRIGTTVGGAPLGNAGDGISAITTSGTVDYAVIGAGTAATANKIAYNAGAGVRFVGSGTPSYTIHNQIRGNSIHDNGGAGIALESSANGGIAAPSITGTGPITGTACPDCGVDLYSDSADEGRVFEGTVTADAGGAWTYSSPVSGPNVTATNTDAAHNTSEFSAPVTVVTRRPDGRIRKGSGSFIGNNIYNTTGANQTKSGSAASGSTIAFGISIQNDAAATDSFKVFATGATTSMYGVRYFRGTTEITTAVVAGTYAVPSLAPGATYLITAKAKVNSSATVGSSVTRLVTITSVGDGTKQDAVKFIGKRS
jgi:hypothetical protein